MAAARGAEAQLEALLHPRALPITGVQTTSAYAGRVGVMRIPDLCGIQFLLCAHEVCSVLFAVRILECVLCIVSRMMPFFAILQSRDQVGLKAMPILSFLAFPLAGCLQELAPLPCPRMWSVLDPPPAPSAPSLTPTDTQTAAGTATGVTGGKASSAKVVERGSAEGGDAHAAQTGMQQLQLAGSKAFIHARGALSGTEKVGVEAKQACPSESEQGLKDIRQASGLKRPLGGDGQQGDGVAGVSVQGRKQQGTGHEGLQGSTVPELHADQGSRGQQQQQQQGPEPHAAQHELSRLGSAAVGGSNLAAVAGTSGESSDSEGSLPDIDSGDDGSDSDGED